MKLTSMLNKLPLVTLLSLGLVCTPPVVSAGDSDHGRHSDDQQDRDGQYTKTVRDSGYREYGHHQRCSHRNSYHKARRHGYVSGHQDHRRHGPYDNDAIFQRYQWDGHDDQSLFLLGLLPGD
jgi:hypothetical protein